MDTEKTHLLKVICISWQNLQPQPGRQMCLFVVSSSDGRSCLDPHPGSHQAARLWPTGWDPSAQPCCLSVLLARRLALCHRGFVSSLGDEGFQVGDQNPNQQLPPSPGCSFSCANGFTQNTVANKGHLYLPAPVPVCWLGLWFLSALDTPWVRTQISSFSLSYKPRCCWLKVMAALLWKV